MQKDLFILCIKENDKYLPVIKNNADGNIDYYVCNDEADLIEENYDIILSYKYYKKIKIIKISLYVYSQLLKIQEYNNQENELIKKINMDILKQTIKHEKDSERYYKFNRLLYKYENNLTYMNYTLEDTGKISLII